MTQLGPTDPRTAPGGVAPGGDRRPGWRPSTRQLAILAIALWVALAVLVGVLLWLWHTPEMTPVKL